MNDIASRILREAESEAAELTAENNRFLEELESDAAEKEEKRMQAFHEEMEEVFRREVQRYASRENIQGAKNLLIEKTRIISETLNDLKSRLREEEELYREFMATVMLKGIQTGREEILVSEADRSLISNEFLMELNSKIEESLGKKGEVTLSDETRNTEGGFFLREGKREFNATVEAVVETVTEKYQLEIIAMLFGETAENDEAE